MEGIIDALSLNVVLHETALGYSIFAVSSRNVFPIEWSC